MRSVALLTIVGVLLSVCVVSAQESKVDFSGQWTLNAEKSSQAGGGGERPGGRSGGRGFGMGASKMTVTQKEGKLVVEAFRQNRDGQEASTLSTYTLDGKKCENVVYNQTRVSTATWDKEGKALTIASTMTMSRGDQEFTMETKEKWSVDKDTLTIETTRSTPQGDRTSKAVYDRVQK